MSELLITNKIIVTGGAGFVGSHLIEKLLEVTNTSMIYIIDNLVRTNSLRNIQHLLDDEKTKARIKFINADISTFDFESVIDPFQISHVFHLAATRINRCNQFNLEGHTYIADSGFKLINWISKYSHIKLYFASSASVYQSPKQFPILETDNCNPKTIYGSGKLYTENIIRSYNLLYGLDYVIHRFFSVYGPRMDNTGAYTEVIFNWLNKIKSIKEGKTEDYKIKVYGNPAEKILDLVYVDDVIDAIIKTVFSYESNNTTFNVSTETGVTLTHLITTIQKVTFFPMLEIESLPENRKDVESKRIGSTERLRTIGWKQNTSLEEGLRKTWEWINGKN